VEQPGIERLFGQKDVAYVSVTPMKVGTAELLEVVNVTDFGRWLMVRVGNMKVTMRRRAASSLMSLAVVAQISPISMLSWWVNLWIKHQSQKTSGLPCVL